MKEIPVDLLREEIYLQGAVVAQTKIFHPTGQKLHTQGDVITLAQAKLMWDIGMKTLFFLEPGEEERVARKTLGVERIAAVDLQAGDAVREDVRRSDGELVVAEGATLDGPQVVQILNAGIEQVSIRKRKMEAELKQAAEYMAKNPPPSAPSKVPRPDTRVTRVTTVKSIHVRPLLVPRARLFVMVPDELFRSILVNTLVVCGHEVAEFPSAADALAAAEKSPPDIVILDFAVAADFATQVRERMALRNLLLLVCVEEARTSEAYKALLNGANDIVGKPPRRDILLDKIRALLALRRPRMKLESSLLAERRKQPRTGPYPECRVLDKGSTRPLPLTRADVRDLGERGARLEYNVLAGTLPHAYTPHTVHPRHILFPFAKANPLSRELRITLQGAGGASVELPAKVMHVWPCGEFERAGIEFQGSTDAVARYLVVAPKKT